MALTAADPLPDTLRTAIIILLVPEEGLADLEAIYQERGTVPHLDSSALGDVPLAMAFILAISAIVNARLAEYADGAATSGTVGSSDARARSASGDAADPRGRRAMARRMREGERHVLVLTDSCAMRVVHDAVAAAEAEEEEEAEGAPEGSGDCEREAKRPRVDATTAESS
jgi:hypothetical protein